MENNEIMVNDEMMEVAESKGSAGSGKGLLIGIGCAAAAILGGVMYKYIKKKRAAKNADDSDEALEASAADDYVEVE